MKAIVYTEYGGPEVLRLREIPAPVPGDKEVLVKVFAASVNDWDWGLFTGDFINRLMFGWRKPKKQIPGSDIAGVVITVGKEVKKFQPGDEVFGDLSGKWGGFAEYVCASEDMLALKSAAMSFEQAAAIPQAAMLAVQGLIDKGQIQARDKILLNGAGGGVGTFAIQLAALYQAEVTVVDSAAKLEMLRNLGAVHTIDYTKTDFTAENEKYDLILDAKTNRSVFDYLKVLKPGGRYVTVGGSLSRLLQILLLGPFISLLSNKRVKIVALKTNKDLLFMNEMFESGKVKPVIDGHHTLEDVPEAFRYYGRAVHKGKIVITIEHGK